MRKLTVRREKRFSGCLSTAWVYISDPNGTVKILDTPCRLLGKLKNGQEESYEIGSEEAIVFVTAGRIAKNSYNDLWRLPAGEEDVILSGRMNGFGGGFDFDNQTDEFALQSRKRGKSKRRAIWIVAFAIGIMIGLFCYAVVESLFIEPKDFTAGGLTITLDSSFHSEDTDSPEITGYANRSVAVVISLHEKPVGMELREFVDLIGESLTENNGYEIDETQESDGLIWFVYHTRSSGRNYLGCTFFYNGPDGVSMVQFIIRENNLDRYWDSILEWAKSVRIRPKVTSV